MFEGYSFCYVYTYKSLDKTKYGVVLYYHCIPIKIFDKN